MEVGGGGGYWIQPILLTKQFQQVETCFWISTPPPPPQAFSCPPLLFLLFVRCVVGPHFHFSGIDFTSRGAGKASL